MPRTVRLHGGPMHGETVTLADDRDHFHIVSPAVDYRKAYELRDDDEVPQVLPTKEGMYSKVRGEPNDFEWDGWRSHD